MLRPPQPYLSPAARDRPGEGQVEMQVYRRYELSEHGRILNGEWFEALDDEDALERIRAAGLARMVEVWQSARRVGCVEAS